MTSNGHQDQFKPITTLEGALKNLDVNTRCRDVSGIKDRNELTANGGLGTGKTTKVNLLEKPAMHYLLYFVKLQSTARSFAFLSLRNVSFGALI